MTACSCPASSLTSVAFAHGVVMQRCRAHELQTWTVDGRRTDAGTARELLKDLFVQSRGQRGAPGRPRAQQVSRTAAPPLRLPGNADEQLTALLHARGLAGTWTVA